jgi:DNA-binding beta-propeller fold protein YncE
MGALLVRNHEPRILIIAFVGCASFLLLAGQFAGVARPALRGMRDRGMRPMPETVAPARDESAYRSPFDLAFSPDGKTLAVSDRTAGVLYLVDTEAGTVRKTVKLQGRPMAVAWPRDVVVLVSEYDAGTVALVDGEDGEVVRRFRVGPKPVGVAVALKKKLLVVCDYGLQTVSLVDLQSGRERTRMGDFTHPYFVAVTPDERMAVVGNLIPKGPATDPAAGAAVSLIDLDTGTKIKEIALPDGSSDVRQVRVSPDGRWAYVVHIRGRTKLPTTQLDRGWVNTNALSIIDLAEKQLYATALLDTITEGAADPWGIALSPDGKTAWISLAGVHQIARIELGTLHEFLAGHEPESQISNLKYQNSDLKSQIADRKSQTSDRRFQISDLKSQISNLKSPVTNAAAIWQQIREDPGQRSQLSYHLSALYAAGLLTRVPIDAQGPRGIALSPDGRHLAVASYYSGEVLLLEAERCRVRQRIRLGPQPAPDEVRRGESIFHDGRYSFQHWLSCATCHPDGRADGLNWDLINDGIGNPKNAKSLLWSDRTPPLMSLGIRANLEEAVQKGFRGIEFREVNEPDLRAVRAYLGSLTPEASPYLVNGQLSDKARKGQAIFENAEVGCAACHPAPMYTSMKFHDVGTQHELDRSSGFDTPTCVELWRTAPYLHDGSAATLRDVLVTMNPNDRHGKTSHLGPEEIDALIEFLLSL